MSEALGHLHGSEAVIVIVHPALLIGPARDGLGGDDLRRTG